MKREQRKEQRKEWERDGRGGACALPFFFLLCSFLIFIACELGGPLPLPSYTIAYNANGGIGETGRSTHTYGAARNLNANRFTRFGYRFIGWAVTPTGGVKYADGQSVESLSKKDGDVITLYAVWAGNSFTVVYDKNDGAGPPMAPSSFICGEENLLRPNTFTREGYVFIGWVLEPNNEYATPAFRDKESAASLTAEEGGTVTLYAQWGVNNYMVYYNRNGGEGNMEPSRFTLDETYTLSANVFTRVGYTFAGWAKQPDGTVAFTDGQSVTYTEVGEIDLYAVWQGVPYTVAYDANNSESTETMANSAFTYGTAQTLRPNAFTRADYAFAGWARTTGGNVEFTDEASGEELTTTAGATVTLYAQWLPAYTVSFNADGGDPAPAPQKIAVGGKVNEPPAMSKPGYVLEGWYRESTFATKWNFANAAGGADTVNGSITLYAKWIPGYTVTFNADGGDPAPVPQKIAVGGKATEPPAMSKSGYAFVGWYREPVFSTLWDFALDTVSADITLYAQWEQGVMAQGTTLAQQLDWVAANAASDTTYFLYAYANESLPPRNLSYSGKTGVVLTLRGSGARHTVSIPSNGSMFSVDTGVTLILGDNITLLGRTGNDNAIVRVTTGGTLTMHAGSILTGNNSSTIGGGVCVSGGTFTMNGGEISGNYASSSYNGGGGVYIYNSATFTMNGGKISGNSAYNSGGGVYIYNSATFTMYGGEISGNTSRGSDNYDGGGGVYVGYGAPFTMYGGKISGNTAYRYGGGVYVDSGTFTMYGGEISGNTSRGSGGGVYMDGGTFTKTGGTITGYNSDPVNGNAVKNSSGAIVNNNGHAVYVRIGPKRRETTAGPADDMDSSASGAAGGWE